MDFLYFGNNAKKNLINQKIYLKKIHTEKTQN